MDLERGSFYSPPRPSTSPAFRSHQEPSVALDGRRDSMSFSIDGREMNASSAFLIPGQEFACMDAPPTSLASPEPPPSASPSIGGSPAWVRTSVGAGFLSNLGDAPSHLKHPQQASPPPSRHRDTRTSPEMLEAFGRSSPAPSAESEPRSLENSFDAVNQAPHQQGGSRGSPLGLSHQHQPPNQKQNYSQGATGPSHPQRAATPQLRFQAEQDPPQWPADPVTLRPDRPPGAEQQQQREDKGGSRGGTAEGTGYRTGSPAHRQDEERRARDSPDPMLGAGLAQRPPREAEATETDAAAARAAIEEDLEALHMLLAETAAERDAAVRQVRELREALAGRAEAMARLEDTLEATETALASTEERFGRAQESVSGDLSAGRAREQQLRLQLTDAEEKAESRARSLAEADRKISAIEASEEKLLQLIEAQQADIRVLNSKLSDREASFASLKEALIDADSEKHGLGRAVQRARDDTDDMRRANRVLQRSIEGQEKEIEELKAALSNSKEELRELQRRNHWLECQQQGPPSGAGGGGLRGSLQQLPLEPRPASSASLRSSLDAERLLRDAPTLAPRPLPMPPPREEWASSRPGTSQGHRPPVPATPSSGLSQDDLGVLKHLMGKVKAAKGSGPIDPSNPPGLSPDERQIFKYLWDKMKEDGGPGEVGGGAALPGSRPPEPSYEHSYQSSAEPSASHDLPRRRFANRPAPFATGAGYNDERPPSAGRPGAAPREQQQQQPGATPFGTDRTLQSTELSTKDLEERLLSLNQEKDSLDAEYSRMPLNTLRTQAQRERKAAVEERLDKLTSEISSCKRQIKKAGAM